METTKPLYNKLLVLWKSDPKDLDTVGEVIDELKIEFLKLPFLPSSKGDRLEQIQILQMQRDVLEIAALFSLLKQDIPGFQRTISQLKHYYSEVEPKLGSHSESPLKYQMLGLDLMCLLSQNKLPDFHMELEFIPPKLASSNVYIDTAVKLEQYLMEGGYNKIFLSKANMPSPYYSYFVDILLDTVRDEIAQCMEKAYEQLGMQESARMLFFDGDDVQRKVLDYSSKRGWELGKNGQCFEFCSGLRRGSTGDENQYVDAKRLAEQNIFYAKQLEMIV